MSTNDQSSQVPCLISNTRFASLNDPSLNKEFSIKNTTYSSLSTYSHSNGISDYLKNKIPGLGDSIFDDHDRPADLKIVAEDGSVSNYSVLRAQLTDIQDQVNEYLTDLMKQGGAKTSSDEP